MPQGTVQWFKDDKGSVFIARRRYRDVSVIIQHTG